MASNTGLQAALPHLLQELEHQHNPPGVVPTEFDVPDCMRPA